ncbi:unnamed protein product [Linum tenue]|uniref:S-protein homolog n=1 Tax=Linum tenue TaxID=586396 RepID=A0AAV0QBZ6_9ROSI|nr:unnamed protein product [Linum tenue]
MIQDSAAVTQLTVSVANKLSSKKAVIVHCQSADDDLHGHAVVADSPYSWSFGASIGAGTVFWCRLAFQDKRLGFTAYNVNDRYYVTDHEVYDDGVYGNYVGTAKRIQIAEWY